MKVAAGRQGRERRSSLVRLDAYREAVRAADFLRGTLHDPDWLKTVTVEVVEDGARVVVVLAWETPLIRRCLPTAVNNVVVHIAVEGRG